MRLGSHHTKESNNKNRKSNLGKKKGHYNAGENHPMFGKHKTQETKTKISDGNKGKIFSDKSKKLMSKNHANVSGNNNPNYKHGFAGLLRGYGRHKISFMHPNCEWHHVNMMFMVACPIEIHENCFHHVLGSTGIHAHFLEGVLG